ncbi:phosphatidylinositol-glycan biosynthesis class S protein [Cordyceps javanica]|uniref:Phosphatidylinositol-glycan biosynthesis class S protein n=1 Tax=Cordyceps javanica TaxID=43265 RepID=A0A545ULA6_9HYPO|nr:phosphatidylinositol-glycan biosynthesis class S protein [Cordyceps javanica]TQW01564.1 phosphatidylinositol-glycan biosynthesis class S protein [Cordyceps javanica]
MAAAGGGRPPSPASPEAAAALAKRTTRSLRYAPTYHLTFSLFTDRRLPNAWDIDRALDEYVRPMLDALAPIHNFTIDTQVQLYATPGDQSEVLSKESLSSFIKAAGGRCRRRLAARRRNQTIRLNDGAETSTSQSWMIPQWDTVSLLPLPKTEAHVSAAALKQPMLTFGPKMNEDVLHLNGSVCLV